MLFERNTFMTKEAITSLLSQNANCMSPQIPQGVYYSPSGSNCVGETINVIAVFMRTDFQSGKHSRLTFLLSTIQPFTFWVIIAAHLKRLFSLKGVSSTAPYHSPFLDLFLNCALLKEVVEQNNIKLLEYNVIPLRQGYTKLYQKPNCKL